MFELKLDYSSFENYAKTLQGAQDQVPYALALALNKANENTRLLLMQEWPRHVKVRNAGFIGYALRRGPPAMKNNLRIEIYDQTGKSFVKRLDGGGRHDARGRNLAIPSSDLKIGSRGVRKSQLPRNLSNTFVASRNGKGEAIWQRVGKGKRKHLRLMYVLKPSVPVPSKMPFTDDFAISILNECRTSFPAAMARAMKTRRV